MDATGYHAWYETPRGAWIGRTELRLLRQGILQLAPKYREPLLLQVVMGYSCDEISKELGVSKSAVMTQLFRARGQLKTQLQKDGVTGNVQGLF